MSSLSPRTKDRPAGYWKGTCTAISGIAALVLLLPTAAVHGQVQLDRFYPPAVTIGNASKIKAEGKFSTWPPKLVCDRPDITLTPDKESGVIEVRAADDASPGVAWIRLFDDVSATSLIPLLVESEAVQLETEPNDRLDASQPVNLPILIAGKLEKSGDLDAFTVDLKAGQTFIASLRANQILGSPMDAVLQLADSRGNVLAQSDDVLGLDPQIVYLIDADVRLHVRVFSFPETPNSTIGFSGDASHAYLLRLTTGPLMDHSLPLIVSDKSETVADVAGWNLPEPLPSLRWTGTNLRTSSLPDVGGWQWHDRASEDAISLVESGSGADEAAVAERLPIVFSGRLGEPGEIDRLRFPVRAGERYRASVHARRFGFELDSVLRIVDPVNGQELGTNDDGARNQYDAVLEYRADVDRQVELQISDLVDNHGLRAAYSIVVESVQPRVALSVSEDRHQLSTDQPLEINVTIDRTGGDSSKVQVVAEGLPEGVACPAVVSEPKGDSSKSVKLKLTCGADLSSQGSFRIVGYRLDADGVISGESIVATFKVAQEFERSDLWLTVTKK